MVKSTILLFFLIIVSSAFSQRKTPKKIFHENGNIKIHQNFDEQGRLHGDWKDFFEDGTPKTIGRYEHGKREGEWIVLNLPPWLYDQNEMFAPDPNDPQDTAYISHYKDDFLHGEYVQFWSGEVEEKGSYRHGNKHGIWEKYSCSSVGKQVTCSPDEKFTYQDGVKHGSAIENTAWGIAEGTYLNGKRSGTWVYYFKDNYTGEIDTNTIVTYQDNVLNGSFTYISGYNNEKKTAGIFVDGIAHGPLKIYREDELILHVEMDHGIPNGWLINKKYGNSIDSLFFINGIVHGSAVSYHEENDSLVKSEEILFRYGMPITRTTENGEQVIFHFQKDYAPGRYLWTDTLLTNDDDLVVYEFNPNETNSIQQVDAAMKFYFPTSLSEAFTSHAFMLRSGQYFKGSKKVVASMGKNEYGQVVSTTISTRSEYAYDDYGYSEDNTVHYNSVSDKLEQFEVDEIYQDYDNGQVFIEGDTIDGARHGRWKVYFENGQVAIDALYQHGDKHGLWKYYDIEGNIFKAIYHTFDDPDDEFNIYMVEAEPSGKIMVSVRANPDQDDYSVPPLIPFNSGIAQKTYHPDGSVQRKFSEYGDYYEQQFINLDSVNFLWTPSRNLSKWTIKTKNGKIKVKLFQNKVDQKSTEKHLKELFLQETEPKDTVELIYTDHFFGESDSILDPVQRVVTHEGKWRKEKYYNRDSSLLYTIDFYNNCKRSLKVEDGFFYKDQDYSDIDDHRYYASFVYYKDVIFDSIGFPHGSVQSYTHEGRPYKIFQLKHGKKHGKLVQLKSNGDTLKIENYRNDTLEGKSVSYSFEGKIEEKANYANGELHGEYLRYYSNGILAERGEYKNGEKVGKWITKDIFGQTISAVDFSKNEVKSDLEVILPTSIHGEKLTSKNGRYTLFAKGQIWDTEQEKIIKTDVKTKLLQPLYNHNGGYEGLFNGITIFSNTGRFITNHNQYEDLTNSKVHTVNGNVSYFGLQDNFVLTEDVRQPEKQEKADEYGEVLVEGEVIIRHYPILSPHVTDSLVLPEKGYKGMRISTDEQHLYVVKDIQVDVYQLPGFKFEKTVHLPIELKESSVWNLDYNQLVIVDFQRYYPPNRHFINGVYAINLADDVITEHHNFNAIVCNGVLSVSSGPKGEIFLYFEQEKGKAVEFSPRSCYYHPNKNKWMVLQEEITDFDGRFGIEGAKFKANGDLISSGIWSELVRYQPENNSLDTVQPAFVGHEIATGNIVNGKLQLFCNSTGENEKYKWINIDLSNGQLLEMYKYDGIYNRFGGYLKDSIARTKYDLLIANLHEKDTSLLRSFYDNNELLMQYFDVDRYNYSHEGKIMFDNDLFVNTEKTTPIEQFVEFYFTSSDELIFYTPDHYYMGNSGIKDGLYFSRDFKIFPFEQFDLKYNRPDIILDRLGYADSSLIQAYYKAYQKRLKKMGFTEDMLQDDFHLPEINIENFEEIEKFLEQSSIDLELKMEDTKYNLDRINVWINDVAIYGSKGISLRDKSVQNYSVTLPIELANGKNKIQVSVLNQAGAESYKETIEVEYNGTEQQPNLYLITLGASKFQQSDYNLTYAEKDAQDVVKQLSKSQVYKKVFTKTLTNEELTKENVIELRSFLDNAGINDHVMIFLAGHGVLSSELDYYLATYDMNFDQPEAQGLKYEDLEGLLDGIKSLKKVLFIDACHSGEIDKEEVELAEAVNTEELDVQFRAVGNSVQSKLGSSNTLELTKSLFTDLRKGTGATVISSAGGMEFAIESATWQNGLFTYALIDGLRSGDADLNNDGEIWLSELQEHIELKVLYMSRGKQHPTSRIENQTVDFRIW